MRLDKPETGRLGVGLAVAALLVAVAVGLLLAFEAPSPAPALGTGVSVDPPGRHADVQQPDRRRPGRRCEAGEPKDDPGEPSAGATPVLPPGDEDAGDEDGDDSDDSDDDADDRDD